MQMGMMLGVALRSQTAATPTPTPAPFTAVAADGWQATVTSPSDLSLLSATASRQGFDAAGAATTYNDTYYLTKRVRDVYPNQGNLTANNQALSDYVYSTDTIAGVTNSSAETSPKPVAAWVNTYRRLVGNSIDVEVVAFHRDGRNKKSVACVVFRATDGTTTVTSTVTSTVVSGQSWDKCAVLVYKATIDISTLSDNTNITVNAKVYPWIGDSTSVLDSADQSAVREFSPRVYRKNTTRAAAPIYIALKSTGNDSTGVTSTTEATAVATPCLTPDGAINRARALLGTGAGSLDGLIIVMDAGTWVRSGSPTANTVNAEVIFQPISGVSKASCIFQFGAANTAFQLDYFRMKGLTVQRIGAFSNNAANGGNSVYEDCAIDFNGNTTTPIAIANTNVFYVGCDFGTNPALQTGSATIHALFRGCTGGAANSGLQCEWYVAVGNQWTGMRMSTFAGRSQSGTVIAFNKHLSAGVASGAPFALSEGPIVGAAIVQNLVEYTLNSGQLGIGVSSDGQVANTTHVIMHHNTFVGAFLGGRCNLFYDETTGTARTHKLQSCKGNIHVQINTKSDVFKTDGTRTGNWAYEHGVGCDGEFSQYIDASSGGIGSAFAQEYPGLHASIGTSSTVRNDPLFTTYAGATWNGTSYTAGAGGGTYTLQGGSPCAARLPVPLLSHDLAGTARPAANDASGAYAA